MDEPMIRCRFRQPTDDPRPVNWPIKHPYWVTGEADEYWTIVAYADNEAEILANWPEATIEWIDEVEGYTFTSRFPRPEWLDKVQEGQANG
jgi:hypothetical protein